MTTLRIPASTLFSSHTGAIVGGVAPTAFSITPIPSRRPSWLIQSSGNSDPAGKAYPAVEFYPAASLAPNATALGWPILPNTGNLQLCFDMWVDEGAAAADNVYETDTLIVETCADGTVCEFNLSGQRHNATGEIDDGNWTDTGLRLGPITPCVKHRVKWTYSWDLVKKVCSVLSYECDWQKWPIAAKVQNMPAKPSNWTPNRIYTQLQKGALPAGLPSSWLVGNIRYHFS